MLIFVIFFISHQWKSYVIIIDILSALNVEICHSVSDSKGTKEIRFTDCTRRHWLLTNMSVKTYPQTLSDIFKFKLTHIHIVINTTRVVLSGYKLLRKSSDDFDTSSVCDVMSVCFIFSILTSVTMYFLSSLSLTWSCIKRVCCCSFGWSLCRLQSASCWKTHIIWLYTIILKFLHFYYPRQIIGLDHNFLTMSSESVRPVSALHVCQVHTDQLYRKINDFVFWVQVSILVAVVVGQTHSVVLIMSTSYVLRFSSSISVSFMTYRKRNYRKSSVQCIIENVYSEASTVRTQIFWVISYSPITRDTSVTELIRLINYVSDVQRRESLSSLLTFDFS